MDKRTGMALLRRFMTPVVLIVLGLVLVLSPDSASALIAKVLGWILLATGIGFGVAALTGPSRGLGKLLPALVFLGAGMWLLQNPLVLAAGIGRLVGILLLLRGLGDLLDARKQHRGVALPVITILLGVVLAALPMTTSRFVLSACGLVVLGVGVAVLIDRLRDQQRLDGPEDPNIIDAL